MGNCVFKGYNNNSSLDHNHKHNHQVTTTTTEEMMIKVVTTTGGIMELYAPITADQITSEFPGHALFHSPDTAPLRRNDHLYPGQLYYLLPLSATKTTATSSSSSAPPPAAYRMSFDAPRVVLNKRSDHPAADVVVPRYNGTRGVWKVRLVINPEQLSEILSQDSRTEELIESVRTVAKCGTTGVTSSSAASSNSDHCSVSSSCNFNFKASL